MKSQAAKKQFDQTGKAASFTDLQVLQGLVDQSETIIWAKDLQGRYIQANQSWFDKHGFTREAHLGKTDHELLPEDVAELFTRADKIIQQTGQPQTYDLEEPLSLNGRFFRTRKFPIFNDAGEMIAIGGIQTDISEAKNATDKLEIHRDRQRLVKEISLSGIMAFDAIGNADDPGLDFRISDANNYAGDMFQMRSEDMIGKLLSDLLPGHWPAGVIDVYRRVLRTGQSEAYDIHYDYDDLDVAIRANAGRTQRGIVVAFTAITDLVEAQTHLQKLNRQMDLERARYLNQYRNTPALLYSTNDERHIIEGSDRFFEHLGYDREEVIGKPLARLLTEETEARARKANLPEFYRTGTCSDLPYRFVAKNGKIRDMELSAIAEPGSAENGGTSYLAVLDDVTERNAAQAAIMRKNLELQKVNKSLESFAYIASHDLQEPLRKIRQFSQIFVEDHWDRVDDDGRYILNVISSSAQRMSKLITDLLAYSRASNRELDCQSVDLADLVSDICGELELKIAETGAQICSTGLPVVNGDRARLEQVFRNLISNALKYRHPDRVPIITIGPCDAVPACCIKISDNGIGFDTQYGEQIFQPFRRLHASHEYEGSGIGLALCRTICAHHGWTIGGEGRLDEGSTFSICLGGQHGTM